MTLCLLLLFGLDVTLAADLCLDLHEVGFNALQLVGNRRARLDVVHGLELILGQVGFLSEVLNTADGCTLQFEHQMEE